MSSKKKSIPTEIASVIDMIDAHFGETVPSSATMSAMAHLKIDLATARKMVEDLSHGTDAEVDRALDLLSSIFERIQAAE